MKRITDAEFLRAFNEYFNLLSRIAYSYTLNKFDAEDVVQEVFIKFYRAHKTFNNNLDEKYWLIRITINQSLDCIKQRKNKKEVLIGDEYINNLPETSDADEKHEEIRKCVLSLKDSYKNIIILYYYDDYSIKEIANILKISESNVTTRLSRAKKKLKEIIIERGVKNER